MSDNPSIGHCPICETQTLHINGRCEQAHNHDKIKAAERREHARVAALVTLLVALPTLPDTWPPNSVSSAMQKALNEYERIIDGR